MKYGLKSINERKLFKEYLSLKLNKKRNIEKENKICGRSKEVNTPELIG